MLYKITMYIYNQFGAGITQPGLAVYLPHHDYMSSVTCH